MSLCAFVGVVLSEMIAFSRKHPDKVSQVLLESGVPYTVFARILVQATLRMACLNFKVRKRAALPRVRSYSAGL